ncbi:MAG: D-alanyl-D-alanine carboxypeptidase/D-alanyl-D-alanine-endopeptidase [Planctomycetota bacterium]
MLRFLVVMLCAATIAATDLNVRLAAALAQVPRGGEAAVAVWDCGGARWLAIAGDPGPLRLASTTKLLVSAAALTQLGTDFRFVTRIYALGPLVSGSIPGIGVIGGGDPTLDEHFWSGDPERCLRDWAGRMRAAGILRVDGDVVIDNRLFRGPIRPTTYPTENGNAIKWFSAPASAFAFNDNCIDVRAVPTSPGSACRVEVRPRSPRVTVDNRTRTVSGAGDAMFLVDRAAQANAVSVTGNYSKITTWFPVAIHEDPDLLAGDAFAAALRDMGIVVTGTVRIGDVDPRNGPLIIEHRSDLLPVLTVMNQRSQNFYAEQLLRIIGNKRFGSGSISDGARAVREACAPLMGDDASSLTVFDGSGLSYGNVGSARAMCRLLASLDAGPFKRVFVPTLKDKPYAGLVGKVKTGTLATASCLAGYVEGRNGRLAFAIELGQGQARGWDWGSKLRERLFEVIADVVR